MRHSEVECRSLKGRICLKFHAKFLNGLQEKGVENVILVFLVLASSYKAETTNLVIFFILLNNLLHLIIAALLTQQSKIRDDREVKDKCPFTLCFIA